MQVDRVTIEDYRAVHRLTIGLDPVTTVIGEHDCGKSTLMRAIAAVLDPAGGRTLPAFTKADFHHPGGSGSERATRLSITLLIRCGDVQDSPARRDADVDEARTAVPAVLRGRTRFALRVEADRRDEDVATRVTVIAADGSEIAMDEPLDVLVFARRRIPALVVRWRRSFDGRKGLNVKGPLGEVVQHISEVFRHLAEPGAIGPDDLREVLDDVRRVAGDLADQLEPTPQRPRSIEALADMPQPLETDLRSAARPDAGTPRHVALLLLLGGLIEAIPEDGLPPEAGPIILFDDIEANLHPIWLAAVCSLATNLPVQHIVTTHSSDVLTWMPLRSLRRLVRRPDGIRARFVGTRTLSGDELRRVTYHLRLDGHGAFFARCWVLVEGETEAWLIPEFARLCGIEFPIEGIRVIEFAQCGVTPLIKLARALDIEWTLLADGDRAGNNYAEAVRSQLDGRTVDDRLVQLEAHDIEHDLFKHGYADVIRRAAGAGGRRHRGKDGRVKHLVREATERKSKPGLALAILQAANERRGERVPPALRRLALTAQRLARGGGGR